MSITTIVGGALAKRVLDGAIDNAKNKIAELEKRAIFNYVDYEEAVHQHVRHVESWSSQVKMKDMLTARSTEEIFIPLRLSIGMRSLRFENEVLPSVSFDEAMLNETSSHIAILGQPGAGKTTLMRYLCRQFFVNPEILFKQSFPMLIKIRDLPRIEDLAASPIVDAILHILGINISFGSDRGQEQGIKPFERREVKLRVAISLLEDLNPLLIIEGFDEFPGSKEIILNEIRSLTTQLHYCKILVTSRTATFDFSVDNMTVYEVDALDAIQIEQLAASWFRDSERAMGFVEQLKLSPIYKDNLRPITLAHLCVIHERTGRIPDQPKTIYKKIVGLLLEEWDEQNSVQRTSNYAQFPPDRKIEFLSQVAYRLTTDFHKQVVFNEETLTNIYHSIYTAFDLPYGDAKRVVREIESHTGLLVRAGYAAFEFSHLSLQEYLAAEYVVKLPVIPDNSKLKTFPQELAIAIALSSDPSRYMQEVVVKRFMSGALDSEFFVSFVSRLLLENPSFSQDLDTTWAFLLLFSAHFSAIWDNKLDLPDSDTDMEQLQGLARTRLFVKQNTNPTTIFALKSHYEKINDLTAIDGSHVSVFELKKSGIDNRRTASPSPDSRPLRVFVDGSHEHLI